MNGGWRYRLAGIAGTAFLTTFVIFLVNNTLVLQYASTLPLIGRLPAQSPVGSELVFELVTGTAVVLAAFIPLYKPRPMRILDAVTLAQKRVLLAMVALAAIGYFDYTYRLPRITVLLTTPLLLVVLPSWFVYIRRRPSGSSRAVIIGNDPEQIKLVIDEVDIPIFGYLSPSRVPALESTHTATPLTDGGRIVDRIGGFSRIEDVFLDYDIDTAFLAFAQPDREEFFGALDTCYEHGVDAKVHRDHVDSVLTSEGAMEAFVDVDIEPWDVQDYIVKRGFDVAFSGLGLLILSPLIVIVALLIKLDDRGKILYRQDRTAVFGETFEVYKFRTMKPESESPEPLEDDDNPRITRVGQILRQSHLDEIPQLWSILVGDMSVVGPRAVWTEEESLLEEESEMWRKRWFVKPGLTGLAQIHDASSTDPEEKLRLDLEYVRQQSFWYDLKIVLRQVWKVGQDLRQLLTHTDPEK